MIHLYLPLSVARYSILHRFVNRSKDVNTITEALESTKNVILILMFWPLQAPWNITNLPQHLVQVYMQSSCLLAEVPTQTCVLGRRWPQEPVTWSPAVIQQHTVKYHPRRTIYKGQFIYKVTWQFTSSKSAYLGTTVTMTSNMIICTLIC